MRGWRWGCLLLLAVEPDGEVLRGLALESVCRYAVLSEVGNAIRLEGLVESVVVLAMNQPTSIRDRRVSVGIPFAVVRVVTSALSESVFAIWHCASLVGIHASRSRQY